MTALPRGPLAAGFGALTLGALAALLPELVGEPVGNRPALRGLALAVVVWMVAAALLVAAGWRSGSRTGFAGADRFGPSWPRALLRKSLSASTLLLVLALPALVAGAASGDVEWLCALLQASWGWRTPLHFAALGCISLVVLLALARLAGSLRAQRLQSARLLFPGLFFLALGGTAAALLLLGFPAPVGWERASKGLALVLFASLCLSALLARSVDQNGRDLRAPTLALGVALAGFAALGLALEYLAPSADDLADVRTEKDINGWTLLDGTLRDRPDLHGIFGLAPGATRLELVGVLPGEPLIGRASTPQGIPAGLAHLEVTDEEIGLGGDRIAWSGPGGFELFVRSGWLRWLDRPSGLKVASPGEWAVSPSLGFAVSILSEPGLATASAPRDDGEKLRLQQPGPLPRYRIAVARRSWFGSRSEVVATNLPQLPRVLWIDERAVRFLLTSETRAPLALPTTSSALGKEVPSSSHQTRGSSDGSAALIRFPPRRPQYLGLATYLVDERRWVDQKWSAVPVGRGIRLSADRSFALAECGPFRPPTLGQCVFDLENREDPMPTRQLSAPLRGLASAIPLAGGTVAAIWYEDGDRSSMHWFVSIFGPDGSEKHREDLAGSTGVRLSRELEDGSVAIARRSGRVTSPKSPSFDWRLEAIDPATGARRSLGDGLAAFPFPFGDVSRVFLERSGRLVVPTAHGLVDARIAPRSFRSTLDSTARVERSAPSIEN